ncbi:MAG: response regulator transcription factor [Bacillota bacterium]
MVYKIMMIDDDIPMLEYLKTLIDFKEMGLEIVFHSPSSLEAINALNTIQPDIILTDIGIPKIDGIELASIAKTKNEHVRLIFLTCHEDFSYAKKAIELEVDDYLLKEELTAEKLKQSLQKVILILDQNQIYNKKNVIENDKFLKYTFVNKLQTCDQNIDLFLKKTHLPWQDPDYKLVIGYIPMCDKKLYEEYYVKLEMLYNTLNDYFYQNDQIEVFINNNHLVIIYNYKSNIKFNVDHYLKAELKKAGEYAATQTQINCAFILFKDKLDLHGMSRTYQHIINNRERYFYRAYQSIQEITMDKNKAFIPLGNLMDAEMKALFNYVEVKDEEKIQEVMIKIKTLLYANRIEPNDVLSRFLNAVIKLELHLSTKNRVDCFSNQLNICWTMEEVLFIFQSKLIDMLAESENYTPVKTEFKDVQDIDNYIAAHLSENISSIDMANYLHFNPSYFSRYFKRLTGYTFTDYAYRYKMTAACRYLIDSDQSVEEIGLKLGFSERTYFTKVFKKYVGQTPGQYRNR